MKPLFSPRALSLFCLFLLFVIAFLAYHFYSNAPVTTKEIIRPDETAQTQRAVTNFIRVVEENKTSYIARGAHSKGHACVRAHFTVLDGIAEHFQAGVFASPGKQYKSWIRFSNGRSSVKGNHDASRDAHGMAIKLINIDMPDTELKNQDFLMLDSPVFFTANVEDYNAFVESENKILYFLSDINPFKWQLRELRHGLNTLKPPPLSPLHTQYFSNTAYKLGEHNIKFTAKSCTANTEHIESNTDDPDFLSKNMAVELENGEGCFDFMVQLQDPDEYMPIEDPSIKWKESDSPFVKIASITIPSQQFNNSEQQAFCENLSYSPWHTLASHRPIGELNRVRQEVYKASSDYRHKNNQTAVPTNLDW